MKSWIFALLIIFSAPLTALLPVAGSADGHSLLVIDQEYLESKGWSATVNMILPDGTYRLCFSPPISELEMEPHVLFITLPVSDRPTLVEEQRAHFGMGESKVEGEGGCLFFDAETDRGMGLHCCLSNRNQICYLSMQKRGEGRLNKEERQRWVEFMRSAKLLTRVSGEITNGELLFVHDQPLNQVLALFPPKRGWKRTSLEGDVGYLYELDGEKIEMRFLPGAGEREPDEGGSFVLERRVPCKGGVFSLRYTGAKEEYEQYQEQWNQAFSAAPIFALKEVN